MNAEPFIDDYFMRLKHYQEIIFDFLDGKDNQNAFQNIIKIFKNPNFTDDKENFQLVITIISRIAKNHRQSINFNQKIEQIILLFKEDLHKNFSNFEIFNIFKKNKRILLFLFNEKIIIHEKNIIEYIDNNYHEYFYPEFKNLYESNFEEEEEEFICYDIKTIIQSREIGENDDFICKLIRDDNLNEFIEYVNQNEIPLDYNIFHSEFETNSYLVDKQPTLIQYSSFFGSVKIFKYLIENKCEYNDKIWIYSIHGNSFKIIQFLKEQNIEPSKKSFYVDCFLESLNCHHNDISDYFFENYVEEYLKSSISEKFKINYESALFRVCLENYNFSRFNLVKNKFYDYQFLNENGILYISCKYGYNGLLKFLISQEKIDINHQEVIQKNGMILTKKQSVIFTALAKNDIELIKLILSHQKIDVNQKCIEERFPYFYDNDYSKLKEQTILNIAIEKNLIDVVKILLSKQEIDVNLKSKIEENDPSIFLSHNRIIEESTPLSTAVANKNKEIIKLLLSKNEIDINQKLIRLNHLEYHNEKIIEKTALSMAIDINDKELINLILSHPKIDINQKYDTQLYDKIMIDNDLDDLDDFKFDDCNKYELKKKYAERNTILNLVIKRRNQEIAQILLSRADINLNENEIIDYYEHGSFKYKTENNSALNIAIENECIDVIKFLLMKKEININLKSTIEKHGSIIEEKSPLSTAIEKGNKDIVELLLCREDIDINQKLKKTFQEPIYFGIGAHNDDDYEYIVEKIENNYSKSNIKIIEKTVLFIAFEKNNAEIVLLLLKQPKIDIDLLTDQRNNKIALFLAIKMKSPQIVKLLLSNPKIDVNQKAIISNSHFTVYSQCSVVGCYTIEESPLHLAVKMQNIEIIKLLLNVKEINVNCIISTRGKKSTNEASLHTAIKLNNLEIVQLLLSKPEIDVNIKLVINEKNDHDNERKIEVTPICLAVRKNNLEMLKLLLFTNKIDLNTKLIYSCNECIEMETFYDDFGMEICKPFKNKYTYIEKSLFQIAVDNGNLEIVNFLLSYLKSDINEIFVVKETIKN